MEVEIPLSNTDTLATVRWKASNHHKVNRALQTSALDLNYCTVDDLYDFILNTTTDRALYLESVKPPGPSYKHSYSVSKQVSKNSGTIKQYVQKYELYVHWFCVEVYEKFSSPPDEKAQAFSESFNEMMNSQLSLLKPYELSYASLLCRALDRYLFPSVQDGCLLHKPILNGEHSNQPDGYGAKLKESVPSQPILVYNFKAADPESDYCHAKIESLGYCQTIFNAQGKYSPILIMPCTQECISLSLCWPINHVKHADIKICKATSQQNNLANFFMH